MIKKNENAVKEKKVYVSVGLETLFFDKSDVLTVSKEDEQAGNDITKDDIFG